MAGQRARQRVNHNAWTMDTKLYRWEIIHMRLTLVFNGLSRLPPPPPKQFLSFTFRRILDVNQESISANFNVLRMHALDRLFSFLHFSFLNKLVSRSCHIYSPRVFIQLGVALRISKSWIMASIRACADDLLLDWNGIDRQKRGGNNNKQKWASSEVRDFWPKRPARFVLVPQSRIP
jgi:hypothetical protein